MKGDRGFQHLSDAQDHFARAMTQFTGLTILKIHRIGFWRLPIVCINGPSISLPHLHELHLTGGEAQAIHLLLLFHMPVLDILSIRPNAKLTWHAGANGAQRPPLPTVRRAILHSIPTPADMSYVPLLIPNVEVLTLSSLGGCVSWPPETEWIQTLKEAIRPLSCLRHISFHAKDTPASETEDLEMTSERLDILKEIELVRPGGQWRDWDSASHLAEWAWIGENIKLKR